MKPDTPPEQVKKIEGHSYDGIEELDNQLPNWWLAMFYLCIAFAGFYFVYYQIGEGPGILSEYQHDHLAAENARVELAAKQNTGDDTPALIAAAKDPTRITAGRAIFQGKCVACHGAEGQGVIGPNLTDEFWIHGGKLAEISHTISVGVLDKGMPPWGTILKTDEIQSVVAYIHSIQGTHPANAKGPQGTPFTGKEL